MLYKARNKAINFFDEYSSVVSETKNKARNEGKGNINSQTIASKITDTSCKNKKQLITLTIS